MAKIEKFKLGYLAAIIDGEGTIGLRRKKGSCKREYHYRPSVEVYNNSYTLVNWCKTTTNIGRIEPRKRKDYNRTQYIWVLCANQISPFLKMIHNFLIIKKSQADLLIKYCDIYKGRPRITPSQETEIQRALIYEQLAILNKRGTKNG